ncbi:hypothetical protein F0A16_07490 [Salinicola corii]|uniref:Winged helix-turn-helix transcriptional regulator n=1 Tax=Salinicola corii TaxID=2606937 RepID=A0A640WG73_9GAMM|nr:hypothetical protein [Salinicola corii]KAA0019176.1 hypothetical protein F0A16_07490 [Salinicola corii]
MSSIGVLSGDIVASRDIADKRKLRGAIDTGIERLGQTLGAVGTRFRGDAFQLAVPRIEDTIVAAVIMRASLIEHSPSRQQTWDARIAIGIGEGKVPAPDDFINADGEAFVRSGQGLDALSQSHQRLGLFLAVSQPDLNLLIQFADDIISHWSHNAAEVVRLSLLADHSQSELAKRLGRSQPTINRRLSAARWSLIREFLEFTRQRLEAMT